MGSRYARTFSPICEAALHTRCPSAAAGAPGCSLFCGSGHKTGWRWLPSRVCPPWAPILWFRQAARPQWSPGLCLGVYEMEGTIEAKCIMYNYYLQFWITSIKGKRSLSWLVLNIYVIVGWEKCKTSIKFYSFIYLFSIFGHSQKIAWKTMHCIVLYN